MSMWKKILLVNLGGLVGIIISLFVASPQTPFWLWAVLSAAALAVLNYVCFGWRRTANSGSRRGAKSTVVIALGVVVLLVDLILRYLHR